MKSRLFPLLIAFACVLLALSGGLVLEALRFVGNSVDDFYKITSGIGSLLLGVGTMGAILFLPWQIQALRLSAKAKEREAERSDENQRLMMRVAEEIMDLAHDAQRALELARNPFHTAHEIEESWRELVHEEIEGAHSPPGTPGVVVLWRLRNNKEVFSGLHKIKPKGQALLNLGGPVQILLDQQAKVYAAALLIFRTRGREEAPDAFDRRDRIIYDEGPDDPVTKAVGQAIRDVEERCVPVLRGGAGSAT